MEASFKLDTSGRVEVPTSFQPIGWAIWSDFSPLEQGYMEALFADPEGEGPCMFEGPCEEPSRGNRIQTWVRKGFSDLSRDAVAMIRRDCVNFENYITGLGMKATHAAGERFWRGRQDGSLTGAWAAAFPPLRVSLTDDGKIALTNKESL